ncbi:ATP-dependent RNA helicase [Quaeritorhiza haematococci]|nr:ATP-dependent RNA helicase [Quaeritorhiza haematococci]
MAWIVKESTGAEAAESTETTHFQGNGNAAQSAPSKKGNTTQKRKRKDNTASDNQESQSPHKPFNNKKGKNKRNGKGPNKKNSAQPEGDQDMDSASNPTSNQSRRKRRKTANGGNGGGDGGSFGGKYFGIEDLGWSEIAPGETFMMADDGEMGGFYCLEEIDGVDVEIETGLGGSKLIKFKQVSENEKKGSRAKPYEPLPLDDSFIYLDDFKEEADPKDKKKKNKKQTKKEKLQQQEQDQQVNNSESGPVEGEQQQSEDAKKMGVEEEKETGKEGAAHVVMTDGDEEQETPEETADEIQDAPQPAETESAPETVSEDADVDTSAWETFSLHQNIMKGIRVLKFSSPTEIQSQVLPIALTGKKDIIGAAETGSGKTLAFGLPILNDVCARNPGLEAKNKPKSKAKPDAEKTKDNESGSDDDNDKKEVKHIDALILTPTRELAMQVAKHLNEVGKFTGAKVVSIVGGMSLQKQRRLLNMSPHIVVGTPGRLWELVQEDDALLARFRKIRYLVIDEADRMLEAGHFKDLEYILRAISRAPAPTRSGVSVSWEEKTPASQEESGAATSAGGLRRTFLFSATLIPDMGKIKETLKNKKQKGATGKEAPSIAQLVERLQFNDRDPAYVNLVPDQIVSSKVTEAKIDCLQKEKDAFLYYVLARYPGRTVVFVNSIDNIRRLVSIVTLVMNPTQSKSPSNPNPKSAPRLQIPVYGLHAEMPQRQRLKNLDRFREYSHAILIASDVAARGLDVPDVDHIVHYNLPRSADVYVHRSGRTARGRKGKKTMEGGEEVEGLSVVLLSPDEVGLYKKICHVLKKDEGLSDFPVDRAVVSNLKERLALAKRIEEQERRLRKDQHEQNWLQKAAQEADLEWDSDLSGSSDDESPKSKGSSTITKKAAKAIRQQIAALKSQLFEALSKPIFARGVSRKYITSNVMGTEVKGAVGKELLPEILMETQGTSTLLPMQKMTTAIDDIKKTRGGRKSK